MQNYYKKKNKKVVKNTQIFLKTNQKTLINDTRHKGISLIKIFSNFDLK